jgi:RND family efflux transporter MFP subunit
MKYKILITIGALLPFFFACGGGEAEVTTEIIRPVRYGKIIKVGGGESQTFSGSAQSSKSVDLSFRVAGTINNLKVKLGDFVRAGQTIAVIDATDYNIQYEQSVANKKSAETQIKSAETNLITSKSSYERVEKLYENNSVPLSEYEQAKSAYEGAKSQYDAALAQVTASEKQVEASRNQVVYAQLKAPFSGIITQLNVEENELVNAGTPIAILVAAETPEVTLGLPEGFINRVKKGQQVDIEFSVLSNKSFTGTVTEVAYSTLTPTYPVIIEINNPTEDIRPGMAANVTFNFEEEKSAEVYLIAPVKSIGEDHNGNFVFQLQQNGSNYKAVKKAVEIGALRSQGFVVRSGITEGDLVATAGLQSLLDGMDVRLFEE